MIAAGIQWLGGDSETCDHLDRVLAGSAATPLEELARTPRRSLLADSEWVFKIHHSGRDRHALREALKRRIGQSPARREWRAAQTLADAGLIAVRARAWGRLANGDEILVSERVGGVPLIQARMLTSTPEDESKLADAIATAVMALHAAGYRHGDLHLGNLRVSDGRVVLMDLQHVRRGASDRHRAQEVARLDFDLARHGWSWKARQRVRAVLAPGTDVDAALRGWVRDYLRGRVRRRHRPGRDFERLDLSGRCGLRRTSIPPETIEAALNAAEADPRPELRRKGRARISRCEVQGRTLWVKRIDAGSSRRAFADRFRGSPAARAFRNAARLQLLRIGAAPALGYVETRRAGRVLTSWLISEEIGQVDLDTWAPEGASQDIVRARRLGRWLAEWHAWGVRHRDLKASNLRVNEKPETRALEFALLDLEDLRFEYPLQRKAARLTAARTALVQLNASIPDEHASASARLALLDAYLDRWPAAAKGQTLESIAEEIAQRSRLRAHRWRGPDRGPTVSPESP